VRRKCEKSFVGRRLRKLGVQLQATSHPHLHPRKRRPIIVLAPAWRGVEAFVM
jgi:hypothetical protein